VFPRLPRTLLDPRAKREWYRIKEEARRLGLVTPLDAGILAGYCELWSRWSLAQESLHKTALLVKNVRGEIVPNPLVGIEVRLLREMRAYMVELGLTPSARSRVQMVPADEEEDPFGKYLEESKLLDRLEEDG
jgi:P27 family predicted phage terminase small subunit